MKIVTIVGARPQFIKAAALSRTLARINSRKDPGSGQSALTEIIVHTGQHYNDEMSQVFFRELAIPEPSYNLGVGSGPHGQQTGRMLSAIERVLMQEKPAWVLVYGDTNSTLAGALAAAKVQIPVAHVEAGLRSYNRTMPEEINRVLTDRLSHLLFCPSRTAVDNLAKEGIQQGVHLIGDVMYEALMFAADTAGNNSEILARLGLKPKEFLLSTVHRAENTEDLNRLANIMAALAELAGHEEVLLPLHPRTRGALGRHGLLSRLQAVSGLQLIDPVGYLQMVALLSAARLILTDSGGMQKEAYWLGVPCLTLREETEWVETVEAGWNVVTGAETSRIVESVSSFQTPNRRPPLYGDQTTTEKIIRVLLAETPANYEN